MHEIKWNGGVTENSKKSPKIVQNLLHILFSHTKFPPTNKGVTVFYFISQFAIYMKVMLFLLHTK